MSQGLQYTTTITATSSGGAVAFGLKALRVTVINTGSSDAVYVDVTTTSGCTTGAWAVKAGTSEGQTFIARRGYYSGLSYTTTVGAAPPFRLLAMR